jgi:uncharacterized membrane protein
MSISVPSPWPVRAARPESTAWRFARDIECAGDAGPMPGLQWRLARNPSFVPGRMKQVFAALCVLSLGIGAAFWWFGAPVVLPFAGSELLMVALAFWLVSRHAGDAEVLTLCDRELRVEHRCGRRSQQSAFRAEWVRVEPAHDESSLVEISGQGRQFRVGRYLRPELRRALAQELRLALRSECSRAAGADQQSGPQR